MGAWFRAFVHDIQDAVCLFSVQTLAAINLCGVFVWDSWAFAGSFCSVPDSGCMLSSYFFWARRWDCLDFDWLVSSLALMDGELWYDKSHVY